MHESGRKALPDGHEAFPGIQASSGDPPGCTGVVGRPSRMSTSGWEALLDVREWSGSVPNVQEWSGGLPKCPGVVGRPTRMSIRLSRISGIGQETFSNVREWSGGPPGCP